MIPPAGTRAWLLASFVIAAAILANAAAAEDVQSVMLSTDTNCPDALVTGVAANKIGAPLLVTSRDALSAEASAQTAELSPGTVYIVGGPAVVSDSLEEELSASYNTVRLWGVTRYGTSAEVALEFWESAPKAMLVWDALGIPTSGSCELISEAKDLAIQEDMPVLLISRNSIPDQTVDALSNLSTESVVLVGDVGDGVTETLDGMGIEVEEHIKGADAEGTRAIIRLRAKEMVRRLAVRPLVIVAVGSWSDTINAPYVPNGTARLISDENEIDGLITEIQENNYTRIKIVGKPALAQAIYDRLTQAGISADMITGRPAAVAAQVMERELSWIRAKAKSVKANIEELCQKRAAYAEEHFGDEYDKVKGFIDKSPLSAERKQQATTWLDNRRASFDNAVENGSYCDAWKSYSAVNGRISDLAFKYREALVTAYDAIVKKETALSDNLEKLKALAAKLKEQRARAAG